MRAIGIDLGTTSICGVLIDTDSGAVLHSRTENSNAFLPGCAPWERIQDPERIVTLARDILEELLRHGAGVIGVTGQMHGILYTDRSGKAVSPLYTWQDGRGDLPYEGTTYARYLGSHTGYGSVTHFYNTRNALVPEGAVGYCTVQDYLVMRLCGLTEAKIHVTDAASFGCFDLKSETFPNGWAGETVSGCRVAGTFRGIGVSVAIGDNQASVLSTLTDRDGLLLNIGTGSQVSVLSDRILEAPGIETRPYFDGMYLAVGAALCGGRAYAALKDFYARLLRYAIPVTDEQVYGIMDHMLSSDCDPLPVDTRLEGTRTDQSLRGSIQQLSTGNFTPEALTKGFIAGIIRELRELYRTMGVCRCTLMGSGNALRKNKALRQEAEHAFGMSLRIPLHREEAAYGAALYALVSAGYFPSAAEAQKMIRYQ